MRLLFVPKFFFSLLVLTTLMITGCTEVEVLDSPSESEYYFCGGENFIQTDSGWFYDDSFGKFAYGGQQSEEYVFEGKYSVLLDSLNPYGMSVKFFDVAPGSYFETSIWIKNPVGRATLIAGVAGMSHYTLNTTEINLKEEREGWTHYFMSFGLEIPVDTLVIFPFSSGEAHYFDNLEIRHYKERPPLPDSLRAAALQLITPDSTLDLLNDYKERALRKGVISGDLKEYVNGHILSGKDSIPVEMRLKGDWTDHIENGKTSYRIKTDLAYNGLSTFSIQHPQTRNYMHEWFFHRICDLEGMLSTRYDFLPVEINGVNQGIYAIEEHFDKQLLESRNRREGPIVKFDESGFWALKASDNTDDLQGSYPYFESAMITCFKGGRTEKSKSLSAQFENAAILMELFRNCYEKPEEIFDLDQLAKYYALMDLGNIHHALAWHNRRYYYNPVTAKLEIIGFDMIPAILPMNSTIAERRIASFDEEQEDEKAIDHFLFLNRAFKESYLKYLNQLSSKTYLDSMLNVLEPEIKFRESLLSAEFPGFKFNPDFYYLKADSLQQKLPLLDSMWESALLNRKVQTIPKILPPNYPLLSSDFFLKEISVNAYRQQLDSSNFRIRFENFHRAALTVIGYGTKASKDTMFLLDQPISLSAYNGKKAAQNEIILSEKPSKIFFTVANQPGVVHSKKVFSWKKPEGIHPRIELKEQFIKNTPHYKIVDDTIFISSGTLSKLIYIPSEYIVVFKGGTELDLVNRGGFIFNNSVYFEGTSENPVVITSSDSSGQGITILEPEEVHINHTRIFYQNTLDYKGWTLTGALTIYEGKSTINHLEIGFNQCEDGLNIIRGEFDINNLFIHDTHSDAFDADFCSGNLTDSRFSDTGNDCIDFSGSVITINTIAISNSGDKGISAGERSFLTVSDVTIDRAITAIASKDGSNVIAKNISASNCEVGLALFRKKPEYSYSTIFLSDQLNYEEIDQKILIEKGAVLVYNTCRYLGYELLDIDEMYARFEKE